MNTRTIAPSLTTLIGLSLLLASCGSSAQPVPGTPVVSLSDSGAGSLRDLLAAAKSGDTLTFSATGTVKLTGPLVMDKDVTIVADGVTLDAGGTGRALEVMPGVNVNVKGGTLTNGKGQGITTAGVLSKATWGGLTYNQGSLTLDGVTLTGGTANNGGAIYNTGTLTLKSVTMTGNSATIPTPDLDNEPTGSGGGIVNTGVLTIESGTFSGNTAYYTGGAVRNTDGGSTAMLTIKDGLFENNSCTAPNVAANNPGSSVGCVGGALLIGTNTSIQGGTFRGNTSTQLGGAIYISGTLKPVVSISGGTFENNKTTGSLGNGGGAIANQSSLNISGGTFRGNSSMSGGALLLLGGGSLKLSDGTFEGNSATSYGGAFQLNGSAASFEMTGGTMRGNTAGIAGGGINSDIGMTLSGGTLETNTAQDSGGALSLNAAAGKQNTVTLGGTLVVQGNKAVNYGGGVSMGNATPGGLTVNVQGASIRSNASSNSGGGINMGSGSVLNLSAGTIADNTAVMQGGGFAVGGVVTMTGGSVTGNSASGQPDSQGGGFRLYSGSQVIASGGTIGNNTASSGAGVGISKATATKPAGQFTLSGATVSGNKATVSNGGGFLNGGVLNIQSGSVTGNTAAQKGGGVSNTKGSTYTKTGGSVTGNAPDDVTQDQ
ncbi:hypothetical protein [Deinococcus altitudinis]|uniref:hypothetical protein n=1 Tax=Deinococcus altitudinis TaxID=468914 RepID=UPI003891542C